MLVQGLPPGSDYRFKHALIQDAAYENLLKSRRQVLHRRVAEILRDRFADTTAAEPEGLAHHFTQAGMTDDAIEWWGKAGDQALRRSAFQEAIAHLGKAIEMADRVDESTRRVGAKRFGRRAAQTTNQLWRRALVGEKGYAAPETAAAFDRARELAGNADDLGQRFAVNYGEWTVNVLRGELGLARRIAAAMLGELKIEARSPDLAVAHRVMGLTFFLQGEFIEAKNHIEEALRLYDPRWDRDTKVRVNHDTSSAATLYLALVRWVLGEVDGTQRLAEQAAYVRGRVGPRADVSDGPLPQGPV